MDTGGSGASDEQRSLEALYGVMDNPNASKGARDQALKEVIKHPSLQV